MRILLSLFFCIVTVTTFAQPGKLLYASDFIPPRPGDEWVLELEPGKGSRVSTRNGVMTIESKGGATVWLNQLLKGNLQIEFTRRVLVEGQTNDRLSDFNQFWMASDPRHHSMFTGRLGRFHEYDSLKLYYVGMGAHDNKVTRFRKCDGKGNKRILGETKQPQFLLEPGRDYRIRIMVIDGVTTFWVDDKLAFSYVDPEPLKEGYFGFRLLHSRQEIRDVKVFQLP